MNSKSITTTLVAAFVAIGLIPVATSTSVLAQTITETNVPGSFADVKTIQDETHIVITITKEGAGQIAGPVVIPPLENESGIVIVPVPPTAPTEENVTTTVPEEEPAAPGNETETAPEEPAIEVPSNNVTVIEPDGNVTQIPDGNVTNIDNSTVIVTDQNQTVTETPGDVIVIDPPVCGCPAAPEEGGAVEVPAANATETVEEAPAAPVEEAPAAGNDTGIGPTDEPALDTGGGLEAAPTTNDTGGGTDTPASFLAGLFQ